MKNRFAVLALILIMLLTLTLGACKTPDSDDTDQIDSAPTEEIQSEEPKEPLTIKSDEINVKVGEQFSIFVNIEGSVDYENWASLDLVVSYDPNMYSIDEVAPTEITSGAMVVANTEYAPDKVKIAIATYQDLPFGQVVELKCTAKAAGECTAEFSEAIVQIFMVKDGSPTTIPTALNIEPFKVTVTEQ